VWTWHWREKDLHKKLVVIASAKHAIKRKQLTSPEMWKPKFFSISNDPLTPVKTRSWSLPLWDTHINVCSSNALTLPGYCTRIRKNLKRICVLEHATCFT
jgi:hypothetical protein